MSQNPINHNTTVVYTNERNTVKRGLTERGTCATVCTTFRDEMFCSTQLKTIDLSKLGPDSKVAAVNPSSKMSSFEAG